MSELLESGFRDKDLLCLIIYISAFEKNTVFKETIYENRGTVERFVKIWDEDDQLVDYIAQDKSIAENSLRYAIETKNFKLIEYIIETGNEFYVDVAVSEKVGSFYHLFRLFLIF